MCRMRRYAPRVAHAPCLRFVWRWDPSLLCGTRGERSGLGQPHPLLPPVRMKTDIFFDAAQMHSRVNDS